MDAGLDYHQVGRSMSTCLANEVAKVKVRINTRVQVFRASAYTITDRQYVAVTNRHMGCHRTVLVHGDDFSSLIDRYVAVCHCEPENWVCFQAPNQISKNQAKKKV